MTLSELKQHHVAWFSRKNKRFFGDISYRVLHGKKTGEPYLVRSTYQWSDMFGQPKKVIWRLNPIGKPGAKWGTEDYFSIRPLLDQEFASLGAVKTWLQEN